MGTLKQVLLLSLGLILFASVFESSGEKNNTGKPLLRFGVITDAQYCYKPKQKSSRHYRASLEKMDEAVRELNRWDIDFVIHLGDFLDRFNEKKEGDTSLTIFEELALGTEKRKGFNDITGLKGTLRYHVLGNHDYKTFDWHKKIDWNSRVAIDEQKSLYGLSHRYYTFDFTTRTSKTQFRFIVLDGTGSGLTYQILEPQKEWLKTELTRAAKDSCKVILFCHQGFFPSHPHNLSNGLDIVSIIDSFANVLACMNGHNHNGNYGFNNGVHYINFKAMVNKPYKKSSKSVSKTTTFSIVEIYPKHIHIKGYGRDKKGKGDLSAGGNYDLLVKIE